MIHESLWRKNNQPRFPRAPIPHEVDVVVIGGGITGITTAVLLLRAGKRVAVFERERIGAGESGSTSAFLTQITDRSICELAEYFGDTAACLVWKGGGAAIDVIETNALEGGIECGFRRVPAFLSPPFFDHRIAAAKRIQGDARLAHALGFKAEFVERAPVGDVSAMCVSDQALFDPVAYIVGLASEIDSDGSVVREECEVGEIIADPLAVIVNGEIVACGDVVIATHVPLVGTRSLLGATLFQTKLYPYTTYVFGARIDGGGPPPGLYLDSSDPYNYLRVHEGPDGRYAICGGQDHKTGAEQDTESRYVRVAASLNRLIPNAQIERRWSGQVIETADGLPYIGRVADHQYIATGFAGNGLTFGTLAGMMIHDAILGLPNPLAALLDPRRKATSFDAMRTLVAENADYPLRYVADRLHRDLKTNIDDTARGDGRVMTLAGRRVAVHRTDTGDVVKVSAACTHMGCLVRWNRAERTWDCPCHGSRFTPEGLVIGGPAEVPLERIE